MTALEPPHEELHRLIKEIIQLKEQGDMPGAEELYKKIPPLSEQIIGLLDAVEQKAS